MTASAYRVLARTYRPTRLSELIGQDALVRTLANAFRRARIAHAYLLTGIRGVGKTTTARIIAKALNCTGPDGTGGPTTEPCGVCPHCTMIQEDRHLDVLEMDAASHTGINDIREITDSIRYPPSSARYKVTIIDEVHMLSMQAFNGLLKTLEEPPAHAKFVFATTELRKVPVTILSRCQRFDLQRVPRETLQDHLRAIAEKEQAAIEPAALGLIAAAAEGSVRDSLSLLDQAIALSEGAVDAATVKAMLGLADRDQVIGLFGHALNGETGAVLTVLARFNDLGADPLTLLHDLLDLTHRLSRALADPKAASTLDDDLSADQRDALLALKESASLARLARCWQMLLAGVEELARAPVPMVALEMLLIRLSHIAEVPPPGELKRVLAGLGAQGGRTTPVAATTAAPQRTAPPSLDPGTRRGNDSTGSPASSADGPHAARGNGTAPSAYGTPPVNGHAAPDHAPAAPNGAGDSAPPSDFAALVERIKRAGEPLLAAHLRANTSCTYYAPPQMTLARKANAPDDLRPKLLTTLQRLTGQVWQVRLTEAGADQPTLHEQSFEAKRARIDALADHPRVREVLSAFPDASLIDIVDEPPNAG